MAEDFCEKIKEKNKSIENDKKTIKNLVISGGGQTLFNFYGILREASKEGFYNIQNIQSIYGTSAGALVGFIISLNIDWEILDNYLIKRPWNKLFDINIQQVFALFDNMGVFSKRHVKEVMSPLLLSKDLSPDITLEELYEYNHIELHIYATELNTLQMVDFSYLSHPRWKVIDVLAASSAIPLIFTPLFYENQCFIDGCITNDFPICECFKTHDIEETFCIKKTDANYVQINANSSFFDYVNTLIQKIMINSTEIIDPKHLIIVDEPLCTLNSIIETAGSEDVRKTMVEGGGQLFKEFYKS